MLIPVIFALLALALIFWGGPYLQIPRPFLVALGVIVVVVLVVVLLGNAGVDSGDENLRLLVT